MKYSKFKEMLGVVAVVGLGLLDNYLARKLGVPEGVSIGWIGAVLGGVGGLMTGIGARGEQNAQNRMFRGIAGGLTPGNISRGAGQLNPGMMGAINSRGYQNNLQQMADNPYYVPQQLQNMPLMMSAMRANQMPRTAAAQLGRSDMGGASGIGMMLPMAAQATRTMADVGTMNNIMNLGMQYHLPRMQFLQQGAMDTQRLAGNLAMGRAGILSQQRQAPSWWSIGGNAMLGAAAGMGGGMMGGGQQGMIKGPSQQQPAGPNPWGGQSSVWM